MDVTTEVIVKAIINELNDADARLARDPDAHYYAGVRHGLRISLAAIAGANQTGMTVDELIAWGNAR